MTCERSTSHASIRRAILALIVAAQPALATPLSPAKPTVAETGPPPGISVTQKGPEIAPVTIVEFSDFECPFCATVVPVMEQLFDAYPNQIRLIFKHSPLPIHSHAPLAHEAALAAGAQGRFWEMHDLLFANQQRLSLDDLVAYAGRLNLDLAAFSAALADHRFRPLVEQDVIESRGYGVNGTPTFFVNGQRHVGAPTLPVLKELVDTALGRETTPIGGSFDPRVNPIEVEDAPVTGPAEAPVTIVEFSDLQCVFCAQALSTVRQVIAAYDGKVRWIFKHFPLGIHSDAMLAHQAALAGAEQGKFWPMHDALFADQRAVKRDDLIATARRLGLDVPRFIASLDDDRFKRRIEREQEQGERAGVDGTPTFFINGRRLVGAQPFSKFKAIIDEELGGGRGTTAVGEIPAPGAEKIKPDAGKGESNAPITMLWFSDLRSALTPRASELVKQVMDAYPEQIRLVVKHRPLETRADGRLAHEAALAAAAQGKFWPMHDLIVVEAGTLSRDRLIDLAKRAGLDEPRFLEDVDRGVHRPDVEQDLDEARRRDVRGTPVFFVNGQRIDGIQPLSYFRRIVDEEIRRRADK